MTQKNRASIFRKGDAPNQRSHLAIVSQDAVIAKRFANARAKLALRGFACRECVEGGYFITRWNQTKFCRELADLEAFAKEMAK